MFVQLEEPKIREYEEKEGCYGVIEYCCRKGAYLILDNGEPAFAHNFYCLRPGTKVLCTVKKLPVGNHRKLVTIDSVCYPSLVA